MQAHLAEPMLFVTGASRSGTTVLTGMLSRHPEIAGLNEMHYFGEVWDPRRGPRSLSREQQRAKVALLLERQRQGILRAGAGDVDDPEVEAIIRGLPDECDAAEVFAVAVVHLARRAGKTLPCEQTPRNVYYARELLEQYPRARIVHLVRDPRAVVASQKYRWRRRALMEQPIRMSRRQQLRTWVNYHPYTAARLWRTATRAALDLAGHPRFFIVKFEDMVRDPQAHMRELCEFLGVDFRESMLEVEHLNSSYVSTRAGGLGLSAAALDTWRSRLRGDERALVERGCRALMLRLGYELEGGSLSLFRRGLHAVSYVTHLGGMAVVNPRRAWIQARALARSNGRRRAGRSIDERAEALAGDDAELARVFGLCFVDTELETAAQDLVECARAGIRRRVAFVNAHTLNVSMHDRVLQRALRSFEIIYADGVGMALAARMQGARLRHNVNGTDLSPHLCRVCADSRVPIALLGASQEVVEACARVLRRSYPELPVVWRHHGFLDGAASDAVVAGINDSDARIVLVAMGVPRQERWIAQHADRLNAPVVIGVGGLFDFVSGRIPRAPKAVRRVRLEWLFRLVMEPRRLWGRYVLGNPLFLARAVRYAVTGNLWPGARRQGS